ncbi:MAG: hypothetical protein IT435_16020 [Phycisphaerales bacterium]|nr:hypothetical protein [Phycisphaerales bacterium]
MSDDGASITDNQAAVDPGEPWVGAAQVKAHTGFQIRAVYTWPGLGCPHRKIRQGSRDRIEFQISAVEAWRRSQGLDVAKIAAGQTAGSVAATKHTRDMFETMSRQPSGANGQAPKAEPGPSDLRQSIADVITNRPLLGDPAAIQRWATAVSKLQVEIRRLDDHEFRLDQRRGKFIERARATDVVRSLCEALVSAFESVSETLSKRAWRELSVHPEAAGDMDVFLGVMQRAFGEELDASRSRLVSEHETLLTGIESAGSEMLAVSVGEMFSETASTEEAA